MRTASNILHLGVKELRSLMRDPLLLVIIVLAFTVMIYAAATAAIEILNKVPIAVVDEDQSQLSHRIVGAFYPPYFLLPATITAGESDRGMDAGLYSFALDIPPNFERDVLAGRGPAVQLNVDATRMTQAFIGSGQIQAIVTGEVDTFVQRHRAAAVPPVSLALRARFNPQLNASWFTAVMEVIDHITLLSIVLTGAALLREREHGTVEHLLVMPVTPFEIMAAKVWSMGLVVLVAAACSLTLVVQGLLSIPIHGSIMLFLAGTAVHLFAATSMGIFLATYARSMPQFGLLLILVMLPLQILSGGVTPRESMPQLIQYIMLAAPTTHFVLLAQAVLFRGAGLSVVWPQFAALAAIGATLFAVSLARFRKMLGTTT
ncbi:MAG: ABC transporter permease [Gammaproteobacteria bacterium]|nr:ABC transporter permease [Gammaproteobacteria bacterium]